MKEAPKEKVKDPHAWSDYWKNEFKALKINRLIDQAEKLSEDDLREMIAKMVLECKKPPYDQIPKDVLQNVISDAVLNEKKFYGFSVAWVRNTLNNWWYLQGWKKLEKIQREKEEEQEKLAEAKRLAEQQSKTAPTTTGVNSHEDINVTIQNYIQSLKAPVEKGSGMRRVPNVTDEEKQRLGKDRIEQKAATAGYEPDYKRRIQILIEHTMRELARDGYAHLKPVEKTHFKVYSVVLAEEEVYKVECECQEDAELLYEKAKEILDKQLKSKKLKGD